MALSLSILKTLAWDWLDDPNGSYFNTTIMTYRLNLAQRELQKRLIQANKEYYLSCVKTDTVVGQQTYMLPANYLQIIRLEWYEQGQAATQLSKPILPMTPNQRDLLVNVTGDPQYYTMSKDSTLSDGNVRIWPIPQRVVEMHLEYSYAVLDMSGDNDEPDVPLEFQEYIAILATRDCLIKDGRPLAPIEQKLKDYEELLKQVAVNKQVDKPRMVVQSSQDWSW